MADTRTNVDIFSSILDAEDDEVIVSQERINTINSPDFPTDDSNTQIFTESLPDEALQTQVDVTDVDKQKFRSAMGGLTFQFWDEIEAFAESIRPGSETTYEQAKAEINKKVALYAKAHPKEAFTMEIAGAAIPTLLSVFGGVPTMAATFGNIFRMSRSVFKPGTQSSRLSVGTRMNRAGIGAAAYSVGESEEKGFMDFVGGYAMGAPIAGGFILGGNVLSGISTYVSTLARQKFGEKTSKAVRKELNRLMEATGKSEDQVIVDLMNGQLLSENQTLVNLIKTTIQGKGKAQEVLDEIAKKRIGETKTNVIDDLQELATNTKSDASLTRIWKADQDVIRRKEKELYDTVFGKKGGNPNLVKGNDQGLIDDLLTAAQTKGSGVFEELEGIYSSSDYLVPLFAKNKQGVIRILRQPTLEDAEVIRRALDGLAYRLYRKEGKGLIAENIKALAESLRTKLDGMGEIGASLKAVREQARIVRKGREAYDYGLGLLTGKKGNSAEDVQLFISDFGDVPGVMNALRIGITQALKNKKGYQAIKDMANPETPLHDIIVKVLPKEQLAEIMAKMNVASNAAKVSPSLQGAFGSQTADKIQMSRIAGASGGREGGMIVAVVDGAIQYMKRTMGLSHKHAKEYAEIITTKPENYKALEKALIDDSSMGTFMKVLDSLITGSSKTYGEVRAKTGAAEINEMFDPGAASGVEGLMSLAGRKAFPLITGFKE